MDPPWTLAGFAPTRGVALGYTQLQDGAITSMPIEELGKPEGSFLFIWVINNKYMQGLEMLR